MLGLGTYQPRGALSDLVPEALRRGWRVFDTAPNYRGGNAAAELGAAVRNATLQGSDTRDVLISSKTGFMSTREEVARLTADGVIFPDDVVHRHAVVPA